MQWKWLIQRSVEKGFVRMVDAPVWSDATGSSHAVASWEVCYRCVGIFRVWYSGYGAHFIFTPVGAMYGVGEYLLQIVHHWSLVAHVRSSLDSMMAIGEVLKLPPGSLDSTRGASCGDDFVHLSSSSVGRLFQRDNLLY